MNISLLSAILLSFSSSIAQIPYFCYRNSHKPLPLVSDCNYLLQVIAAASHQLGGDDPFLYGRGLLDSQRTRHLPRTFQVDDPVHPEYHNTCGVEVDASAFSGSDQEELTLSNIFNGALMVLRSCVEEKGDVGVAYPGPQQKLEVTVKRAVPIPSGGIAQGFLPVAGNVTATLVTFEPHDLQEMENEHAPNGVVMPADGTVA